MDSYILRECTKMTRAYSPHTEGRSLEQNDNPDLCHDIKTGLPSSAAQKMHRSSSTTQRTVEDSLTAPLMHATLPLRAAALAVSSS